MDKTIGQEYRSVVTKVTANGVDQGAHGLLYKYEYEMQDGTVLSARHKSEHNKLPEGTEVEYVIRGSNDYGTYGKVSKPFNGDRSNGMPYSPNNDVSTKRLTPSQCEGLQGSHDDWTRQGTEGMISDTQRYKMCGNAVTVDVVEAIAKQIKNVLNPTNENMSKTEKMERRKQTRR